MKIDRIVATCVVLGLGFSLAALIHVLVRDTDYNHVTKGDIEEARAVCMLTGNPAVSSIARYEDGLRFYCVENLMVMGYYYDLTVNLKVKGKKN